MSRLWQVLRKTLKSQLQPQTTPGPTSQLQLSALLSSSELWVNLSVTVNWWQDARSALTTPIVTAVGSRLPVRAPLPPAAASCWTWTPASPSRQLGAAAAAVRAIALLGWRSWCDQWTQCTAALLHGASCPPPGQGPRRCGLEGVRQGTGRSAQRSQRYWWKCSCERVQHLKVNSHISVGCAENENLISVTRIIIGGELGCVATGQSVQTLNTWCRSNSFPLVDNHRCFWWHERYWMTSSKHLTCYIKQNFILKSYIIYIFRRLSENTRWPRAMIYFHFCEFAVDHIFSSKSVLTWKVDLSHSICNLLFIQLGRCELQHWVFFGMPADATLLFY